jgi:hypothetical protein
VTFHRNLPWKRWLNMARAWNWTKLILNIQVLRKLHASRSLTQSFPNFYSLRPPLTCFMNFTPPFTRINSSKLIWHKVQLMNSVFFKLIYTSVKFKDIIKQDLCFNQAKCLPKYIFYLAPLFHPKQMCLIKRTRPPPQRTKSAKQQAGPCHSCGQWFSNFSPGVPLYAIQHIQCTINNYFMHLNEKQCNWLFYVTAFSAGNFFNFLLFNCFLPSLCPTEQWVAY